ncbi:MAG: acyl carrier protein [Acidobacteriota bacterium]|nr:acyl carrier protein [Acidobacteriota bacterium]
MTATTMTKDEFLTEFADILGTNPGELTMETPLASLEGWDSVAYLSTMVLIDEKCGVTIGPETLVNSKTPGDIYTALGTGVPS